MRKIRIKVSPPNMENISDYEHFATSYLISKSIDFSNEQNIIKKNFKDEENKLEYITDLDIQPFETVYIRIMFHFKNLNTNMETNSAWSRTTPISGDKEGFKLSDVIISTPIVNAEVDNGTIIIETKPMVIYSGSGLHTKTSWMVTDSDNNAIYNRIEDETNLVKLKTQSINIESNRAYVFQAKHITKTNNHSTYGKKILIDYNKGLNLFDFELLGKFTKDTKVYFRLTVYAPGFKSMDLEVRDKTGNIGTSLYNYETLTGYIDTRDLIVNTLYDIFVRVKFTDGKITIYRLKFTGMLLKQDSDDIYGPGDTEYPETGVGGGDTSFGDIIPPDQEGDGSHRRSSVGVTSGYQMKDGNIIFTEFINNAISLYSYKGGNLSRIKRLFKPSNGNDLAIDYLNVLPLPNNDIIINYCTVDVQDKYKKSIFKKFSYDPIRRELTEIGSYESPTEELSTSVSTSAVIMNNGEIYYIPAVNKSNGSDTTLSLMKLNTVSMTVESVVALPDNIKYNATLIRDIDENLYLFGGSKDKYLDEITKETVWRRENNRVYKFNMETNTFDFINIYLPVSWSQDIYCMQGYLRHDHKIVLFNSVHNGRSIGEQKVLVFDPNKLTFEEHTLFLNMLIPFRNNIVLRDGSILRISSKIQDPQTSYIYASEYTNLDGKPINPINPISNLIVEDGTQIEIEDPYLYDSIEIRGTGILVWLSDNGRIEYTSEDLLITRDTVMDQDEYESKQYRSVHCFDAELRLEK